MNTEFESIGSEENKNRKKSESKNGSSKISLPDVVAIKANETLQALKDRGAEVRIEELFQDLFEKADERYWSRQIERLTPDSYIFEQAKSDPALMMALIKKAKRGLEKKQRVNGEPSNKKRKTEKPVEGVA
ncbi:MAG: hypothetical protein KGQ59_03455 [Bdellovibrionales bacterium]|nr:hypothetical protein [Bdellovibrionales bacterium]